MPLTIRELAQVLPRAIGFRQAVERQAGWGQPGLLRVLGLWTSLAVPVGVMIGSGVFLKPAEIAQSAGTPMWAIGAWVVAAFLSLLVALCYMELATMMPESGGDYIFLRRAFGPSYGFIFAWRSVVLNSPASHAAQAAAVMLFSMYYFPELNDTLLTFSVPGMLWAPFDVAVTGARVGAGALIVGFTLLALTGMRVAGRTHFLLTALKVLFLVGIVITPFALGRGGSGTFANLRVGLGSTGATFTGFVVAVSAALWAFSGTSNLARIAGEVKDPSKLIPRATYLGLTVTTGLYVALTIACFYVLGFSGVATSEHVVSDMLDRVGGPVLAGGLTLGMILSAVGSMSGSAVTAGRLPYAVAKDGLFPKVMAKVHPVTRVPVWAIVVPALVSLVLALTGSFVQLTGLAVFVRWAFNLLIIAGLFRLRHIEPDTARPIRTWGYPLVPALALLLTLVLTITIFIAAPGRSLFGLGVVATGIPVYLMIPRRVRQAAAALDKEA